MTFQRGSTSSTRSYCSIRAATSASSAGNGPVALVAEDKEEEEEAEGWELSSEVSTLATSRRTALLSFQKRRCSAEVMLRLASVNTVTPILATTEHHSTGVQRKDHGTSSEFVMSDNNGCGKTQSTMSAVFTVYRRTSQV